MTKIINISGVIGWDVTAQDVREALAAANGGEVEIHMSSPGGYISVGLEIFNLLRDYKGPISGVLKGYAMSMGSYIPLAIPLNRTAPGKLAAEDNAIYMIHRARGGVWGDDNEILGYGEALKGMSTMIAKAYAKRTGKALDDVLALMDKETYFFGDQIKEHGFVDEILQTEDTEDTDEQSARATATAMYGDMMARMTADQAKMKADLQQVALMLAGAAEAPSNVASTPQAAGNTKTEVQQMKLSELLAQHPTAQAEYNAALATARTDGEKAGKEAVEARINAASPFLNNAAYGAAVGAVALKVLKGEEATATLTTIVTVLDAQKEQNATTTATTATEQTPATPAAPVATGVEADPGMVSDDAGLKAAAARLKGGI